MLFLGIIVYDGGLRKIILRMIPQTQQRVAGCGTAMDDIGLVCVGMLLEIAQAEVHIGKHLADILQFFALQSLGKIAAIGI